MDRINWVTSDSFKAIAQLARIQPGMAVDGARVHARMMTYLDSVRRRAREAGYSENESSLITYALAVLADEIVMTKHGELRDAWAKQPLQFVLFNETLAGENFFAHLDRIREDPHQTDLLRVFYHCLLLGFRGQYTVRSSELALSDLTESVRAQLARALPMPEVLAPDGARPEEGLAEAARRIPLLTTGAAVIALALVLYVGLFVSLRQELQLVLQWMETVSRT